MLELVRQSPCGNPREGLCRAARRRVELVSFFDNHERGRQKVSQVGRAVARDGQARALLGPVGRKGAEDHAATGRHASLQQLSIGADVFARQEVEDGTVVPEVVAAGWLPAQEILCDPLDIRSVAKASLADRERGRLHRSHRPRSLAGRE